MITVFSELLGASMLMPTVFEQTQMSLLMLTILSFIPLDQLIIILVEKLTLDCWFWAFK
jgi:hypothetical protein